MSCFPRSSFLTRPERWLWALHRHRATITAAPNFAYELAVRKIADSDIEGLDLSSLRAALNGAEPVNAATLDRFASRFTRYGFRREAFLPVYGLAESSLAVTIPPLGRGPRVDRVARDLFAREGRAMPVAADSADETTLAFSRSFPPAAPLPNHEVRIVDGGGHEAAERDEGALWFRGPSTTSGYFRNEEASSALFPAGRAAGWLDSGDRAYRAEGEFFITGRVKDIILKAGRNLYPHEVEEIAARVKGVRKGCVVAFGAADPVAGTERLIVVAETVENDQAARQRIAREIVEQVSAGDRSAARLGRAVAAAQHPQNIEREAAARPNSATLSGGQAWRCRAPGVAAGGPVDGGQRRSRRALLAATHRRHAVRNLRADSFRRVDRAELDRRVSGA